ncbi:MAG: hypothetical protein V7K48_11470 [Nostoc sp.]|uniref:hypothetical protein n=1 Tax=Nostoc sp. TaxID=1180 RepID=UPI002FF541E6
MPSRIKYILARPKDLGAFAPFAIASLKEKGFHRRLGILFRVSALNPQRPLLKLFLRRTGFKPQF